MRSSMKKTNESDVVNKLSEKDLENIDNYASLLTSTSGIDENQSYAVAFDAYVVGVEQCNSIFAPITVPSIPEVVCSLSPQQDIENPKDFDYYGASLSQLFRLPTECGDDSDDIDLVNAYGEELELKGGITAAVAYNVALDTFLADPVGFRNLFRRHNVAKKNDILPHASNKISNEQPLDYFGASLSKLFDSANDSDQEINDIKLVAAYAEDLEISGGISAPIAYGIALDVFLSDPVEFRIRFSPRNISVVEEVIADETDEVSPEKQSTASIFLENPVNADNSKSSSPAAVRGTTKKTKRKADCAPVVQDCDLNSHDLDKVEAPPAKSRRGVASIVSDKQEPVEEQKPPKAKRNTVKKQAAAAPEKVEEELEIALAILCDK